jgi:hypothetical protein
MFRGLRKQKPVLDPILDAPIQVGELPETTLRQLRDQAAADLNYPGQPPWEQGMRITIMYLVDQLVEERR